MKKGMIVLALTLLGVSGVFAQALQPSNAKNWFSGEVSILGVGARYEHMIKPNFSIGANIYFDTLFWWTDLGADFSFRGYPWGDKKTLVKGLYFGGSVGFHMYWGAGFGLGWGLGFYGFGWGSPIIGGAITPDVGWKLDVGKPGGFFIEPGMKFPITLGPRLGGGFGVAMGWVPYIGLGTSW